MGPLPDPETPRTLWKSYKTSYPPLRFGATCKMTPAVRWRTDHTNVKAGSGSNRGRRFRSEVRTVSWDIVGNWISAGVFVEIAGFWTTCCQHIRMLVVRRNMFFLGNLHVSQTMRFYFIQHCLLVVKGLFAGEKSKCFAVGESTCSPCGHDKTFCYERTLLFWPVYLALTLV